MGLLNQINLFFINISAAFSSSDKLFHGNVQKDILVQKYLDKMNEADIDLLLFPASIVPAPKQVSPYWKLYHIVIGISLKFLSIWISYLFIIPFMLIGISLFYKSAHSRIFMGCLELVWLPCRYITSDKSKWRGWKCSQNNISNKWSGTFMISEMFEKLPFAISLNMVKRMISINKNW